MPEAKIVYVGIHPYSRSNAYESMFSSYSGIRNMRLRDTSIEQVLFLAASDYQPTLDHFPILYIPYWQGRIFQTNDPRIPFYNPRPIGTESSGLTELLTTLFPADIYRFWGAKLRVWNGYPIGDCVHAMYNQLDHPGKEIEVGACWRSIHGPKVEFLRGDFRNSGPWGYPEETIYDLLSGN